jgi:hypothetical protein
MILHLLNKLLIKINNNVCIHNILDYHGNIK